ncbi:SDR family oxidoreductase [Streptomyces sp. NPDC004647]|uniref:SDR family oxidoreductase n=1 Tax=Streptomyces sp. NPDC004647 TaxID=3154671 RepID=UPI0033A04276
MREAVIVSTARTPIGKAYRAASVAATSASEHITVNALAPGPFPTRMMARVLDDPELRDAVVERVPLGRVGTPEGIASPAIFLASRAGAYLTGTVIPVDGGISGTR